MFIKRNAPDETGAKERLGLRLFEPHFASDYEEDLVDPSAITEVLVLADRFLNVSAFCQVLERAFVRCEDCRFYAVESEGVEEVLEQEALCLDGVALAPFLFLADQGSRSREPVDPVDSVHPHVPDMTTVFIQDNCEDEVVWELRAVTVVVPIGLAPQIKGELTQNIFADGGIIHPTNDPGEIMFFDRPK